MHELIRDLWLHEETLVGAFRITIHWANGSPLEEE